MELPETRISRKVSRYISVLIFRMYIVFSREKRYRYPFIYNLLIFKFLYY